MGLQAFTIANYSLFIINYSLLKGWLCQPFWCRICYFYDCAGETYRQSLGEYKQIKYKFINDLNL